MFLIEPFLLPWSRRHVLRCFWRHQRRASILSCLLVLVCLLAFAGNYAWWSHRPDQFSFVLVFQCFSNWFFWSLLLFGMIYSVWGVHQIAELPPVPAERFPIAVRTEWGVLSIAQGLAFYMVPTVLSVWFGLYTRCAYSPETRRLLTVILVGGGAWVLCFVMIRPVYGMIWDDKLTVVAPNGRDYTVKFSDIERPIRSPFDGSLAGLRIKPGRKWLDLSNIGLADRMKLDSILTKKVYPELDARRVFGLDGSEKPWIKVHVFCLTLLGPAFVAGQLLFVKWLLPYMVFSRSKMVLGVDYLHPDAPQTNPWVTLGYLLYLLIHLFVIAAGIRDLYTRIELSKEGVKVIGSLGRVREATWAEVERFRPRKWHFRFLGADWGAWIVTTRAGEKIRIPRVRDFPELQTAIAEHLRGDSTCAVV